MTPDELITNASPEQLREALRVLANYEEKPLDFPFEEMKGQLSSHVSIGYNISVKEIRQLITNALKGESK